MTNFKEILKIIHKNNIECVLIGGFAAVIHGSATSTADIDIVYKPTSENIKNIVTAFSSHNVKLRGNDLPDDLPFIFDEQCFNNTHNFTLKTDLGYIDILEQIPGFDSYDELEKSSEIFPIYEMNFKVLSLEGLIKNKKLTNRKKDQNVLEELEELRKLTKQSNK